MAAVLEDPVFKRSPTLTRLLEYLLEMTEQGKASSVKSYTIAVDGLGRSGDETDEIDTYARVVVGRLRKALTLHYAGRSKGDQVVLDVGSYALRLRIRESDDDQSAGQPTGRDDYDEAYSQRARRNWQGLAIGTAVLAGLLVFMAMLSARGEQERVRWTTSNFPTLNILIEESEAHAGPQDQSIAHRRALYLAMGNYLGIRLIDNPAQPTDFVVRITAGRDQSINEPLSLVETRTGRLVWSSQSRLGDPNASAAQAAFQIASVSGSLHSFMRRQKVEPRSPYGCWLQFTEMAAEYRLADASLIRCSDDWFEHAGRHPVAAMLKGWTLIDRAVRQPREGKRSEMLAEASSFLHQGLVLNPDTPFLLVALMRVHSLAGDRQQTLSYANAAISNSEGNRSITGLAAATLAFWNDPAGERILAQLPSENLAILPWEHAGLFIAAMMRDDTVAAGRELVYLQSFEKSQPLILILKAAHQARIGRKDASASTLRLLRANPAIALYGHDKVIQRLPMAPEVRVQLRKWMASTP